MPGETVLGYTTKIEGRRINQLYSMEPSKLYAHWQGNNMRTALPKLESEQYWRIIWDKDATHIWLVELRANSSNLPEQASVTIALSDI